MKKLWKLLALLLCAALLLTLCACGGESAKDKDPEPGDETDPGGESTDPDGGDEVGGAPTESLKGVAAATDWNAGFVIDIPDGYHYDDAWSCYTNNAGTQIWAIDMDLYEYDHNFEDARDMREADGEGKSIGLFRYWTSEATEFYGPSTHYFVSFEGRYEDFYGCHILVSNPGDMSVTQSADILDMLTTIRREGETVGSQGKAPAAAAPEPSVPETTPEPTPEPEPTTPFSELWFNYDGVQCAAMSALMNYGRYAAAGDALVGLAYTSDYEPALVRMDLSNAGGSAEVVSYEILDRTSPYYVNVYDGYVYYNRDGGGICRVPIDGGDVEVLIPHACDYLQVCGGCIWFCDEDYCLFRADLDGDNEQPVMDKEIYFPYLLNEDWLLYQDDPDGETLHLRHLPTGEDARVCDEVVYYTYLWNTDLFAIMIRDGDPYLIKIDLINPEIEYDEAAQAFSYRFPVEYGTSPIYASVSFTSDGFIYSGTVYPTYVDEWEDVENLDGDAGFFYAFSGADWDVYWEMSDGYIDSMWIVDRAGGGSDGRIPFFD